MINHARTLLLNTPPGTTNTDMLGDEFIPAFDVLRVPHYLRTPRRVLFGADPDKVFLNFRAFELLTLIHQTELAEFVYALDPRVTYATAGADDFFRSSTAVQIEQITGTRRAFIHISGATKADNIVGRAYYEYFVQIINDTPTTAIAELTPITGAASSDIVRWSVPLPLSLSNAERPVMRLETGEFLGVSNPTPLQETGLKFQVSLGQVNVDLLATEAMIDFETESIFRPRNIEVEYATTQAVKMPLLKLATGPQVIAEWQLKVFARPTSAISLCLPQLEFLGEPFYLELFGVGDSVEPYRTFKNIWFDHPIPAYRLAAFTLAMVYRMEEVRKNTANG